MSDVGYREHSISSITILDFFKDCLYKQGWVYYEESGRFEMEFDGKLYYVEFGEDEE